jgi:ArsR family transcriptional regulator
VNLIPAKAKLLRAMAEEGRLTILESLVNADARVADLADATGQPQPTVSTHLAALASAGLVTRQQEGRTVVYRLAHPTVSTLLTAAEEVVLVTSGQEYACVSPCCNPGQAE